MSTYHDDRRFAYFARLGLFVLTFALLSCGGSTTAPGGGATQLTLVVAPGSATVFVGATTQYTVVATNSSGQVVTAPAVVWTSADPAVGTISTTGLATGVSPGQTIIVATAVVSVPST